MPHYMLAGKTLGVKSNPESEISIHVHDTAKKERFDFTCSKALLEKEMLFFQQYFHELQQTDYFRIIIYSDIQTFKWLLTYIKSKNDCKLDASNILPILVSAEFLQMPELVANCITFLCDRVNEVPGVIANINLVQSATWEKVARCFKPDKLSFLSDDFLLFKNKIFHHKTQHIFADIAASTGSSPRKPIIFRCRACLRYLTWDSAKKIQCQQNQRLLGLHGKWIPAHVPFSNFSLSGRISQPPESKLIKLQNQNELLEELFAYTKSWETNFWCLWNAANPLFCKCCNAFFQPSEVEHGCIYHKGLVQKLLSRFKPTTLPVGSSTFNAFGSSKEDVQHNQKTVKSIHSCCGLEYLRFNPLEKNLGCSSGRHSIGELLDTGDPVAQLAANSIQWLQPLTRHVRGGSINHIAYSRTQLKTTERTSPTNLCSTRRCLETLSSTHYKLLLQECRNNPNGDIFLTDYCVGEVSTGCKASVLSNKLPTQISRISVGATTQIFYLPKCVCLAKNAVWNVNQANRFNQDVQRQDDSRRMNQLVDFLITLRVSTVSRIQEQNTSLQNQQFGGIISKLKSFRMGIDVSSVQSSKLPTLSRIPRTNQNIILSR